MKTLSTPVGLAVVALAVLFAEVSAAAESAFTKMGRPLPKGYERVIVPSSTFQINNGETRTMKVPFGPRDMSTLFIEAASFQGCNTADITVSAVTEGRARSAGLNVSQNSQWYYIEFLQKDVAQIQVSHRCGRPVNVGLIWADLGPHPVDCVFGNCKPFSPGKNEIEVEYENGENEPNESYSFSRDDLKERILRKMPTEGKYYYLSETLNRLLDLGLKHIELGSSSQKYIRNLKTVTLDVSRNALVYHDGSEKTISGLKRLRKVMIASKPFVQKLSLTPVTENWAQAFWTIGEIIDKEATLYVYTIPLEEKMNAALDEVEADNEITFEDVFGAEPAPLPVQKGAAGKRVAPGTRQAAKANDVIPAPATPRKKIIIDDLEEETGVPQKQKKSTKVEVDVEESDEEADR